MEINTLTIKGRNKEQKKKDVLKGDDMYFQF
jgi:hypothetical protein